MAFHKIQATRAAEWWLSILKSNQKIDSLDFLKLPLQFSKEQEENFLASLKNRIWQECESQRNNINTDVEVTYDKFIKQTLQFIGFDIPKETNISDDDQEPLEFATPEYMMPINENVVFASLLHNGKVSYRIGKTMGGIYEPSSMYSQSNYVDPRYASLANEENDQEASQTLRC